jgi:hypothetical protein
MQPAEKKRFLIVNALCWLAAIVVPVIIHAIPVSHPPKILPFFTYGLVFALAGTSTWLMNKAISASTTS